MMKLAYFKHKLAELLVNDVFLVPMRSYSSVGTNCRFTMSEQRAVTTLINKINQRIEILSANDLLNDKIVLCAVNSAWSINSVGLTTVYGENYSAYKRHNLSYQCHSLPNGLLKGCAEQNAIGATAAQGIPYALFKEVIVLSYTPCINTKLTHNSQCGVMLPCLECISIIKHVSNLVFNHSNTSLRLTIINTSSHVNICQNKTLAHIFKDNPVVTNYYYHTINEAGRLELSALL